VGTSINWQPGLLQTFGDPAGILRPLERLPAEMTLERVFRIYLLELAPDAPRLVNLT
jgi:hypothetical protein